MPIIKSAKKRVSVARKATVRNAKTKRTLKEALKAFGAALTTGKKVAETHAVAQSAIDIAVKKNILHKNKAARKKHQLAVAAKAAGKKLTGVSSAPKKTAAVKKPAATNKKPAAKKSH